MADQIKVVAGFEGMDREAYEDMALEQAEWGHGRSTALVQRVTWV